MSAAHIACIFHDHSILPCKFAGYLVSDIVYQFISKCFIPICNYLCLNKITSTAFPLQTNGRKYHCSGTLVLRRRLYVADNIQTRNMSV